MAKANTTTDARALREAVRILNSLPVEVTGTTLRFGADKLTFSRDSNDAWYLSEVE